MKKAVVKRVKATAVCEGFDIVVNASFESKGLASSEVDDVKRKLKHNLSKAISELPFAHIYPIEVRVR